MKKIMLIFMMFAANAFSQSANIVLLNEIYGGNGSYENPYILRTDEVRWKHSISGPNQESAKYMTCVHAAIGRACILSYKKDAMSFTTMQSMTHTSKLFCGTYYIRTHVNDDMTSKIFIHCQVPPVNSYTVPYNSPTSNVAVNPVISLKNILNGSGTWSNPYVIAGDVVQFNVNESRDINGLGDIQKGAWFWAIVTDGWHPIYSHGQELKDVKKTFSYYDEFNDLQSWDTNERPSNTGQYKLTLYFFDQHGTRSLATVHFACDGATPPPPTELSVSPVYLDFDESLVQSSFSIRNLGLSKIEWKVLADSNSPWIKSLTPNSGSLDRGVSTVVMVKVDRTSLSEGTYSGTISVLANGFEQKIRVDMLIDQPPQAPLNVKVAIQ